MSKKIIKTIGTDGRKFGNFFVRCLYCGNKFKVMHFQTSGKYKKKFCNAKCYGQYIKPKLKKSRLGSGNPMFGKRPWNYKDGMSRKRDSIIYWKWRRSVLNRDNQTCQNCHLKLQRRYCIAHHIKSWAKFPELRYVVSNGITYCRSCHNKLDESIKAKHFK